MCSSISRIDFAYLLHTLFDWLRMEGASAFLEELPKLKNHGGDEFRKANLMAVHGQIGQNTGVRLLNDGVLEPGQELVGLVHLQHAGKIHGFKSKLKKINHIKCQYIYRIVL